MDNTMNRPIETMNRLIQWLFNSPNAAAPPATIPIRLMAGGVFVWEGLLQFVFPTKLGVGRFGTLGFPPQRSWPPLWVWWKSLGAPSSSSGSSPDWPPS